MSTADKPSAVLRTATPTPPAIKHAPAPRKPVQQSLALPVSEPAPVKAQDVALTEHAGTPSRRMPVRAATKARLWLCIYLPALPLEALDKPQRSTARAVFAEEQGIRRVMLANEKATAAGIRVGLSVNAALSLLPGLQLEMRDMNEENRALKRLACWAEQFTSFVCIESTTTLLLEIAGSLRLFEGIAALRRRIARGCDEQGFTAQLAIAPTPLASRWFARAGREVCIDDTVHLNRPLSALPLHCLDWPDAVIESLGGMGITCVGDCLRLPRAGFARRFGATHLLQLDRALGRLPDPRVSYRSAERFCALQDLDEEQDDRELLLQVCRQLLHKLEQFLLSRQMQVQRVQFSFFHLRAATTHRVLRSVQAGRSAEHWFELLAIQFDRMVLPEAVISIRLRAEVGQLSSTATGRLLFDASTKPRDGSIACLVERLNARMGDACVRGVATVAEHRPQYAWHPVSVSDATPRRTVAMTCDNEQPLSLKLRRPLWMLKEPERLASEDSRPLYQGALTLLDGPERLESGWWDEDGIARDYFIALAVNGVHLWIYQDRSEKKVSWYLHGIFG